MEQAKRALVRRWLDQNGGMAPNTVSMPIHRSKMINRYAVNPRAVLDALFPPVDLYVGVKAVTV